MKDFQFKLMTILSFYSLTPKNNKITEFAERQNHRNVQHEN